MTGKEQTYIFQKNLLHYLESYDKTQLEVANAIGVSHQTFNTWCRGIALPRMGKIQLLADYFHINKSDLIEEHKESALAPVQLRDDELKLLADYNLLDAEDRAEVRGYARGLVCSLKYTKDSSVETA